jgi:hypothetical protein
MNEKKMVCNTWKTRMTTIGMSKLRKMELFCQWGGLQAEVDDGKWVKTG